MLGCLIKRNIRGVGRQVFTGTVNEVINKNQVEMGIASVVLMVYGDISKV